MLKQFILETIVYIITVMALAYVGTTAYKDFRKGKIFWGFFLSFAVIIALVNVAVWWTIK